MTLQYRENQNTVNYPNDSITIDNKCKLINILLINETFIDIPRSYAKRKGSFISVNSNPTLRNGVEDACYKIDCKRTQFKRNLCKKHFIKSVKIELQK